MRKKIFRRTSNLSFHFRSIQHLLRGYGKDSVPDLIAIVPSLFEMQTDFLTFFPFERPVGSVRILRQKGKPVPSGAAAPIQNPFPEIHAIQTHIHGIGRLLHEQEKIISSIRGKLEFNRALPVFLFGNAIGIDKILPNGLGQNSIPRIVERDKYRTGKPRFTPDQKDRLVISGNSELFRVNGNRQNDLLSRRQRSFRRGDGQKIRREILSDPESSPERRIGRQNNLSGEIVPLKMQLAPIRVKSERTVRQWKRTGNADIRFFHRLKIRQKRGAPSAGRGFPKQKIPVFPIQKQRLPKQIANRRLFARLCKELFHSFRCSGQRTPKKIPLKEEPAPESIL